MKSIPAFSQAFIVTKGEKRAREEGKETIFFNGEVDVKRSQIEQCKWRGMRIVETVSPSAGKWSAFGATD